MNAKRILVLFVVLNVLSMAVNVYVAVTTKSGFSAVIGLFNLAVAALLFSILTREW